MPTSNDNGGGLRPASPRFYRRRATVEAMQWTGGGSTLAVQHWFGSDNVAVADDVLILNGATDVHLNQWIVLSPNNRLHICKPGLFGEVHELALADPPDTPEANWGAALSAARAATNYWKKMAQNLAARLGTDLPQPPDPIPSGD